MFDYAPSKEISTLLRAEYRSITSGLSNVFNASISGATHEIAFLQNLLGNLNNFLTTLYIPGIYFSMRSHSIHQKPMVNTDHGRCELGDLLVVVKYYPFPGIVEAKSIIYQTKLTKTNNTRNCNIDQRQLNFLCDWPAFSFGGVTYTLSPKTIEFGSFML